MRLKFWKKIPVNDKEFTIAAQAFEGGVQSLHVYTKGVDQEDAMRLFRDLKEEISK